MKSETSTHFTTNFTTQKWRDAGKMVKEMESGKVIFDKSEAINLFQSIIEKLEKENLLEKENSRFGQKNEWSITNPRTFEARILTIENEGMDGFCISFQHC